MFPGKIASQFILISLLLSELSVFAQQPTQVDSQETIIRTSTTLVQVHVVAEKSNGEAITGLQKEDFTLTDNGKLQTILSLSPALIPFPETTSPADMSVLSNSVERFREENTNSIIILLDWVNTKLEDQIYARNQAIEFIQKVPAGQKIELLVLDRSLRVIHDLTGDVKSFVSKVQVVNNPIMTEMDFGILDPQSSSENSASADFLNIQRGTSVEITTNAFQAIADRMMPVPGRKILIWISGGFPIVSPHTQLTKIPAQTKFIIGRIQSAVKTLNQANISVYPVDTRGVSLDKNAHYNFPVMTEMASKTGGRVWINRNDLSLGMLSAVEDSRKGYTLGYQLPENESKNDEHQIRIRVNREGVRLRYRKTYLEQKDLTDKKVDELNTVLQSPFNWPSIPLTLRAVRQEGLLYMQIRVGIRNLSLTYKDEKWAGKLNMVAQCYSSKNELVTPPQVGLIQFQLTPEMHEKAISQGLTLRQQLPIPKGCTMMRLIAHDVVNGKAGSLRVDLPSLPGSSPSEAGKQ